MQDRRIHVLEVLGNAIVGGMESVVLRLVERLPAERFRFTALLPFEARVADQLRQLGVDVIVTPMPESDLPWASLLATVGLVQSAGIDLLHAHMPNAHLLSALAGKLADRPVLSTIHSRHVTPLDVEVHRAAGTQVAVVSRHTYYQAIGIGVMPSHLHCIGNGVDTDVFRPRERDGRLRQSLGIPADAPLVGFVGRLSPEKGPEVFARAGLLLAQRTANVHCVLVGDGPMRTQLRAFIADSRLAGRVHLAGEREDMPMVYPELDVLASTSHTEAMPLALMEAMACGLPVIGTRVGGVPDIVEHRSSGWLIAPGDFEAVAGQAQRLIEDPALRQRAGELGRKRVVERFGLADCVQRTAELMTKLARRKSEPRRLGAVE